MGQFLTGVATRIFSISLPTLASVLNTDILAISWAVIAYQLAGISLSVVFGRLGDIHGRHVIYGLGFGIMTASSLLCGLASSATQLILFRFIQGLGAAMISSATRVLAMEAMPEGSEGRANGYMTMGFHSGLLIGPPLGGFVIDLLDWRWIFFLLVPMGLTGVILTILRAKGGRTTSTVRAPSIDYLGAVLLIVLTVTLTLLLDRRSAETIGAERTGVLALVFGATVLGFLAHERRSVNPVVNLSLFKIRMFTFSIVSLLLIATTTSVLGVLQHAEPGGDHWLGAPGIPRFRDRDGPDDLWHLRAARDLARGRAPDPRVPLLRRSRQRHAERRASRGLRRREERHVLRVPRAHDRRAAGVVHARRHQDRGRVERDLIRTGARRLREPRLDADLGRQRAVHRALFRDLEQSRPLFGRQRPGQRDVGLDPVEHAVPGLALGAVGRVDSRVLQPHRHLLERPLLASRVQRDGHGCSGAECREQELVGVGAGLSASRGGRLVGRQAMRSGCDVLGESRRLTTDDDGCHGGRSFRVAGSRGTL